jgi:hypothetical protein
VRPPEPARHPGTVRDGDDGRRRHRVSAWAFRRSCACPNATRAAWVRPCPTRR